MASRLAQLVAKELLHLGLQWWSPSWHSWMVRLSACWTEGACDRCRLNSHLLRAMISNLPISCWLQWGTKGNVSCFVSMQVRLSAHQCRTICFVPRRVVFQPSSGHVPWTALGGNRWNDMASLVVTTRMVAATRQVLTIHDQAGHQSTKVGWVSNKLRHVST